MATWPANGDTDWNTKMLAYLAVEHNTDGTHDMHDATGGYMQVDVDGVKTNVYTKYLTGSLDADATTTVAHGVTSALTKIISVTTLVYDDANAKFRVGEFRLAESAAVAYSVMFDATNITFALVGANCQGNAYRIKIDYIL